MNMSDTIETPAGTWRKEGRDWHDRSFSAQIGVHAKDPEGHARVTIRVPHNTPYATGFLSIEVLRRVVADWDKEQKRKALMLWADAMKQGGER